MILTIDKLQQQVKIWAEFSNRKVAVQTRPKQPLGSLPLDISLPGISDDYLGGNFRRRNRKCKRTLSFWRFIN
jgi:hypothetical protein